jgi:4-amino-4-deoxy-L-arabinose transferase-like glycosyltransferase
VTLVFAAATVLVTYFLGREMYDRQTGLTALLLLLSFPLFLRLGTAALTDVPVTFLFTLALWLILRLERRPSYGLALLAGGVIAVGLLTKYTMALVYPVLCAWYIVSPSLRARKRYLAVALSITAAVAAAWLAAASGIGVLGKQIRTLSRWATSVLRSETAREFLLETLTTRLPAAFGTYSFPGMVLGAWVLLRRRSERDLLVVSWIAVVSVLLMISLPDHRYFLLVFPATAVAMAAGLASIPAVRPRAVALSLLYGAGALYLLVDWERLGTLFLQPR